MAISGELALKDYISELESKGYNVILTKDIRLNVTGFRLDVLKGELIESEIVEPWVASSANWEWLLISRIRALKEKLDNRSK